EEVNNDMLLISETIANNRDLGLLLKSPIVKTDQKLNILDKIFGKHISEISSKFIKILANKRREILLEMIASEFYNQYKINQNIVTARVVSAIPLDDKLRDKIMKLIKSSGGSGVDLKEIVDPNIIGGLVVRVGD